jgi:hypothetical protein
MDIIEWEPEKSRGKIKGKETDNKSNGEKTITNMWILYQ